MDAEKSLSAKASARRTGALRGNVISPLGADWSPHGRSKRLRPQWREYGPHRTDSDEDKLPAGKMTTGFWIQTYPSHANGVDDRGQESTDREVPLPMPEERRIDVKPVVASLKDRLETIRRSEMKRLRRQIGRLSREEEVAIESLTDALVNNIIHPRSGHWKR